MTDTAVPTQHRLMITAEVGARCARATALYVALRPLSLARAVVYVLAFVALGAGFSTDTGEPVAIVWFVLVGVVFAVGSTALLCASAARRVRRQFTVGEEWATGFGAHAMRVETARGKGETYYSAFDRMIVRGGVVLLRRSGSRVYSIFPAELVPTEAQQLLASHLRK